MGDRIEILTNKNARPSRDWMTLVKTPSARAKIRKYFSQENKSDDAERGRSELAKELRKRGYGISATRTVKALDQLTEQFDYRSVDDLFAGIGAGNQSAKQVVNRVSEILEEKNPEVVTEQERNAARLQEKNKQLQTISLWFAPTLFLVPPRVVVPRSLTVALW